MKVSPSGHISGKGYGRDGFIDTKSWQAYRNRKNAENRRYKERKKAISRAEQIQKEISTNRLSREGIERKRTEMTTLLREAEATRLRDTKGRTIPGRTVQSVEQARNNLLQTRLEAEIQYESVMQRFRENKKFYEQDIQVTKGIGRFGRTEIDIIMQQTQHIWEGESGPNKRFDRIMEYFAKQGETDFIEVLDKILIKARSQAAISDIDAFLHELNTSGAFTDKQRERFMKVMALDNADVVTEYLMIEYTSEGVYDISDVVL